MPPWPLILRTGFGNVFVAGTRWDHEGAELIAEAFNSDDWSLVEEYARDVLDWDPETAN